MCRGSEAEFRLPPEPRPPHCRVTLRGPAMPELTLGWGDADPRAPPGAWEYRHTREPASGMAIETPERRNRPAAQGGKAREPRSRPLRGVLPVAMTAKASTLRVSGVDRFPRLSLRRRRRLRAPINRGRCSRGPLKGSISDAASTGLHKVEE